LAQLREAFMKGLDGRVAVVTGGGAGIGEAICHRLAAEGARIAALDISLPAAQRTIKAIGDGLAAELDVSDSAAVDAAITGVERDLGPVDILVNNAGAVGLDHVRRVTPLLERQRAEMAAGKVETPLDALVRLSDEEWRHLMAVHLDGTFYCTRAALLRQVPGEWEVCDVELDEPREREVLVRMGAAGLVFGEG